MYKVVGIDEAGRGPVLGSMFIAFSIINLQKMTEIDGYQKLLKDLGVKDSKLLSHKKRAELYVKLQDQMDVKFAQLTPTIIDLNNSSGGKLNALEVEAIVKVLEDLKPDLVMIDALTSKPEKFGDELLKKLSFECKLICENKADAKYEMVGAASIVAKELREKEVAEIKKNIGLDCGSGYPSDPKTRAFLKEHYKNDEFHFIFRKSWHYD